MILRVPTALLKHMDEVHETVSSNYMGQFVRYMIDSKYRKAVWLVKWIREQVNDPAESVVDVASKIKTYKSHDAQMLAILRYVIQKLDYKRDAETWDMTEHWNTSEETVESWEGDCEDGAILIYVLARLKGIPANRLYIFAGDVVGGGHAWLGYRPNAYPINWSFMDWCYWPKTGTVDYRPIFEVVGNTINGWEHRKGMASAEYGNYRKIWFIFNEKKSHTNLIYNP